MVIAAVIAFAILFVAWLVAPSGTSESTAAEAELTLVEKLA